MAATPSLRLDPDHVLCGTRKVNLDHGLGTAAAVADEGALAQMIGRPVLVAEITGRAPRESLRVVSPLDFKTGEWRPRNPRSVIAGVVPYCLDIRGKRSLYVKAGNLRAIQRAKLQYVHLREQATSVVRVPWEQGRVSEDTARRVHFLFSVGRCGSTLFVDAMRRGGALALSEPDFFTQAVAARIHGGRLYPQYAEVAAVLGNLTADLLCAFGSALHGAGLIKLRAECCKAPDLIMAAQEGDPVTFFMIREFKPWALSVLRASARPSRSVVNRYLDGLQCLKWLRRNTECHLLRYEELIDDPNRVLGETANAMSFSLDPAGVKAAFNADAQVGTALARKRLAERELEPGAFSRAVELWTEARPRALLRELGLSHYC